MSRSLAASTTILLLFALPAATEAQSRASVPRDTVPVGMLPPAGKCRIWMDGVPAAQQPAPTDCATALRQRPANGTILYGPAPRESSGGRFDPSVGGRAPARTVAPGDPTEAGGSKAERELQRRRDEAARDKRAAEARERIERAQQDAQDRVRIIENAAASRGGASPANSRSGGGTGPGTTKPPSEPAPTPPAGPAKKKPE